MNITEYTIVLFCLIFSYIISVMIPATFQAWVAKKCGDHTAEDEGYLTLNPLVYFSTSMISSFLLSLSGVLEGIFLFFTSAPIVSANIQGQWRKIRIFLAYTSGSFLHIIIALFSIVLLMYILRLHETEVVYLLNYADRVMSFNGALLHNLIKIVSNSLLVIFALILLCLIFFNVFFASLQLLFNVLRLILSKLRSEESYDFSTELRNSFMIFLSANLIFIMIGDPFGFLIRKTIIMAAAPLIFLLRTII